jgi:hypothetical protein
MEQNESSRCPAGGGVASGWCYTKPSSIWFGDGLLSGPEEVPRARDRTTSLLQMRHVRRRAVSHGVLRLVSMPFSEMVSLCAGDVHALRAELVPAGKAHDPASAVDILLQTDNTLHLPTHVLPPFAGSVASVLLVGRWPPRLCVIGTENTRSGDIRGGARPWP